LENQVKLANQNSSKKIFSLLTSRFILQLQKFYKYLSLRLEEKSINKAEGYTVYIFENLSSLLHMTACISKRNFIQQRDLRRLSIPFNRGTRDTKQKKYKRKLIKIEDLQQHFSQLQSGKHNEQTS
jgi:hypothetical protein